MTKSRHIEEDFYAGLKHNDISLDSKTTSTLLPFLELFSNVIQQSFTPTILRDGWQRTGQYPLKFEQMASVTPGWKKLSQEESNRILSLLPKFCEEALSRGELREQSMDEAGIPAGEMIYRFIGIVLHVLIWAVQLMNG